MSRRGGIVDIYPPTSDLPARLEFFGNTIDSLRLFDPANQRSLKAIPSISIGPATEVLASPGELESALNRLDLSECSDEVRQQFQQETAMLLNRQKPGNLQFYAPLFNQGTLLEYLPGMPCLYLMNLTI